MPIITHVFLRFSVPTKSSIQLIPLLNSPHLLSMACLLPRPPYTPDLLLAYTASITRGRFAPLPTYQPKGWSPLTQDKAKPEHKLKSVTLPPS